MNNLTEFGKAAKDLSRNPLGIIALFIVLVYGFACLLFGFSAEHLSAIQEKLPLIWFVVIFPVLVLILFGWLVSCHHDKLYSPRDFRDDETFLKIFQNKTSRNLGNVQENRENIEELMKYGEGFLLISEQEESIKTDLGKKKIDYSGSAAKVLIRHLAASQVLLWFEKVYNTIFGSQIALLKQLNGFPNGLSLVEVGLYFANLKLKYSVFNDWALDNYLKYLFDTKLILKQEEQISITKAGREFLTLLIKVGYSESKIL